MNFRQRQPSAFQTWESFSTLGQDLVALHITPKHQIGVLDVVLRNFRIKLLREADRETATPCSMASHLRSTHF